MYLSKKNNNRKRVKVTKKIDKNKCSPKNISNKYTCFSKESLITMIKAWNKYYKNDKIKYNKNNSVKVLWKKLDSKFSNVCSNEHCWIEQPPIKSINNKEIIETFRPKMPQKWNINKNEWLNTNDIENVLKQYEKKHEDFLFIGAVPIDFDTKLSPGMCVINELCKINLNTMLKNKKTKLGVVFNLDKHDEPGSHWVALYGDFNQKRIIFFDSYGTSPPKEVVMLMRRLKQQASDNKMKIKLLANRTRHQYKNSECGVYSIDFIIKLLEGNKFEDVYNKQIPDDIIEKKRDFYFIRV